MNVLFTGMYRQNDGWGRSSQDYLRALRLVDGIKLEAKPLILSNRVAPPTNEWDDLEAADIGKPDVCIFHVPPQFSDPSPSCTNISMFHLETSNIGYSSYMRNKDMFRQYWVATKHERETLIDAEFDADKCRVVPMPINLDFLDTAEPNMDNEILGDKFTFLYLGDMAERKNVPAAILAYWLTFTDDDNVNFLIKVNVPTNPRQTKSGAQQTLEWIERLKYQCRLYDNSDEYPEIKVITDFITDKQVIDLQNRANCFVVSSRGESTCRPMLESFYLGKNIICTDGIGCIDSDMMADDPGFYKVRSFIEPCQAKSAPIHGVYSSWENWRSIDILDLSDSMYKVWKGDSSPQNRKEKVKNVHSYAAIARTIENQLRSLSV